MGAEKPVFVGVHERQLDPKGRLALPAAFRPRLEPRCYLAFGQGKCVDVLTAEAFDQVAQELMQKVRAGEIDRNQQRALAANTLPEPHIPLIETQLPPPIVRTSPTNVKPKPKTKTPTVVRHTVKRGETLSVIAKRYRTTVSKIQQSNSIKGTVIRVGQILKIPR